METLAFRMLFCVWLLASAGFSETTPFTRVIPKPLPSHPGNIFLTGEEVVVPLPPGPPGGWQVVDDDGNGTERGQSRRITSFAIHSGPSCSTRRSWPEK